MSVGLCNYILLIPDLEGAKDACIPWSVVGCSFLLQLFLNREEEEDVLMLMEEEGG